MTGRDDQATIREVFRDVNRHRHIAELIRRYSTNAHDVREKALEGLPLRNCRNILELGCAFGSFTEMLKGRLHPEALIMGLDIIPEYEPLFLQACEKAGFQGRFFASGVSLVEAFAEKSFDLILCSFALYFFPEVIPHVSRLLRDDGLFVAITHDQHNMGELIDKTKGILRTHHMLAEERLPVEVIVSQFCAENGQALLNPWFGHIRVIDFRNSLTFRPENITSLIDYFRFKSPFFLTGTGLDKEAMIQRLFDDLQKSSVSHQGLVMSKDDQIFICSQPLFGKDPS